MRITPFNLGLVSQSAWRITVVHWVAKALGILVHIEGMPFGSNRSRKAVIGGTAASGLNFPVSEFGTTEKPLQ